MLAVFIGGAWHHLSSMEESKRWRIAQAAGRAFVIALGFAVAGPWIDGSSGDPLRRVQWGLVAYALFVGGWLFDAWLNRQRGMTPGRGRGSKGS